MGIGRLFRLTALAGTAVCVGVWLATLCSCAPKRTQATGLRLVSLSANRQGSIVAVLVMSLDASSDACRLLLVDIASPAPQPKILVVRQDATVSSNALPFSHDGHRFAYLHQPTPTSTPRRLVIYTTEGAVSCQVELPGRQFYGIPSWAPDDSALVLAALRSKAGSLYRVDLARATADQAISGALWWPACLVPSLGAWAEGDRLFAVRATDTLDHLLHRDLFGPAFELASLAPDGSDGRSLCRGLPPVSAFSVNPNGTEVALAVSTSMAGPQELRVCHVASGRVETVCQLPARVPPIWGAWSASGRAFFFASARGHRQASPGLLSCYDTVKRKTELLTDDRGRDVPARLVVVGAGDRLLFSAPTRDGGERLGMWDPLTRRVEFVRLPAP